MARIGTYEITTRYETLAGEVVNGPYLLPRCFDHVKSEEGEFPEIMEFFVPAVNGPKAGEAQCAIPADGDNPDDFTLEWIELDERFPKAKLTISPRNVFMDARANRDGLKASFTRLRHALEALEKSKCLIAGGAALVTNRIATSLPLRLDEILFYHYGFDADRRCIDLQPGMRLRIEYSSYQYVAPPQFTGGQLNAFTGGGQAYYSLTRDRNQNLAFDSYLLAMQPFSISQSSPTLVSGVADLMAAGNSRRYWRLVYPATLLHAATINQDPGVAASVVLVGADTLSDLENATTTLANSGDQTTATAGNNPILFITFGGRTVVVPEITILINDQPFYVAVGATIRDILDRFMDLSPNLTAQIYGSFHLKRWNHPSLCSPNRKYGQSDIRFEETSIVSAITGLSQWDLPLVKGDTISDIPKTQ